MISSRTSRAAWMACAGLAIGVGLSATASATTTAGPTLTTLTTSVVAPPQLIVDGIDMTKFPKVKGVIVAPPQASAEVVAAGTVTVLENGIRHETTVKALPADELRVVLVIDTSGSMKGAAIAAAQQAAVSFVEQMPADAQVAVVGFGTTAKVHSQFSVDRTITAKALSSLRVRGQTALHDGLIAGARLFDSAPAGSRRVLVVLSDGGDTASKSTLADATHALAEEGVNLSVIALATGESDGAALSLLTSSAKGSMASAADPAALKQVFASVANSVLRRYEIEWTSLANGPGTVRIELTTGTGTYESTTAVQFPVVATSATVDSIVIANPPAVSVPASARPIVHPASGRRWLVLGLGAGFVSSFLALAVVLWPRPPRRRLAVELGLRSPNEMSGFSKGVVEATRTYFQRAGRGHRLAALLERAGWTMDAPTAAVLAGGISIAVALLSLTIGGLGTALISGGLSLTICYVIVKSKADRRSAKFTDQFEAALQIIINSLKSGYGVSQAIETVAREAESPTSDEFRRVVTETSLGMDQIQALEACSKRTGCDELTWVSEAMEVNREVGGNLSEVLVGIANTIRSRVRLARQVKALSAEGRISAKVLLIVPIVVFVFQFLVNRSAVNELFHGIGLVMLLGSLVSMTIGSLWINHIVNVRF